MRKPFGAVPAALQVPSIGSVHGFRFKFGAQNLQYAHPGIIVAAAVGVKGGQKKVGVIALAISHATQTVDFHRPDVLLVPSGERKPMGLDPLDQWVCLFEQVTVHFPSGTQMLRSVGKAHLGQASPEFTSTVIAGWTEYRLRRS